MPPKKPTAPDTAKPSPAEIDIKAALFNSGAELTLLRLYVVQLVCIVAGREANPAQYVNQIYDTMTDIVVGYDSPALPPETARAVRGKMQKVNRGIYNMAMSGIDNPFQPTPPTKPKRG